MAASARQLIIEEVVRRLEMITIANGYETNAGENVFLMEEVVLGSDDATHAIAVDVQPSEADELALGPALGQEFGVRLPLSIQSNAREGLLTPWRAGEQIKSDIKRAMGAPVVDSWPDALKGFDHGSPWDDTFERAEGSLYVGGAVNYEILYVEIWGAP